MAYNSIRKESDFADCNRLAEWSHPSTELLMSGLSFAFPNPGDLYIESGTEYTAKKSWLVIEYKKVWAEEVDTEGYESFAFMGWKCFALDLERNEPPRIICIPRPDLRANDDEYIRYAA